MVLQRGLSTPPLGSQANSLHLAAPRPVQPPHQITSSAYITCTSYGIIDRSINHHIRVPFRSLSRDTDSLFHYRLHNILLTQAKDRRTLKALLTHLRHPPKERLHLPPYPLGESRRSPHPPAVLFLDPLGRPKLFELHQIEHSWPGSSFPTVAWCSGDSGVKSVERILQDFGDRNNSHCRTMQTCAFHLTASGPGCKTKRKDSLLQHCYEVESRDGEKVFRCQALLPHADSQPARRLGVKFE